MASVRCELYGEDECLGHDCIDRLGTPCFYDRFAIAGTEDAPIPDVPLGYAGDYFAGHDGVDDYFATHDYSDVDAWEEQAVFEDQCYDREDY